MKTRLKWIRSGGAIAPALVMLAALALFVAFAGPNAARAQGPGPEGAAFADAGGLDFDAELADAPDGPGDGAACPMGMCGPGGCGMGGPGMGGMHRVDEQRLRALRPASHKALVGKGYMGSIYAHLHSLENFTRLYARQLRARSAFSPRRGPADDRG